MNYMTKLNECPPTPESLTPNSECLNKLHNKFKEEDNILSMIKTNESKKLVPHVYHQNCVIHSKN